MKKLFKYSSNNQIWKILIAEKNKVILELRDVDNKMVYYNCLELKSGKIIWENKQFANETYWISIETLINNFLILHKFVRADLPLHKEVIVVDIRTGEELWQNEDLVFWAELEESFLAKKYSNLLNQYFRISVENGNILEQLSDNEAKMLADNFDVNKKYLDYHFTNFLDMESKTEIKEIISEYVRIEDIAGRIEFIEFDAYLIFSFYQKLKNNFLENNLIILNISKRKKIFSEKISASTNSPYPDSYFIFGKILFYIKDRTSINAIELNPL